MPNSAANHQLETGEISVLYPKPVFTTFFSQSYQEFSVKNYQQMAVRNGI
jgi:hypothetical protein